MQTLDFSQKNETNISNTVDRMVETSPGKRVGFEPTTTLIDCHVVALHYNFVVLCKRRSAEDQKVTSSISLKIIGSVCEAFGSKNCLSLLIL